MTKLYCPNAADKSAREELLESDAQNTYSHRMNSVQFFEIQANNPQAAMTFYSGVFGWKFEKQAWAPIDYWQISSDGINGGLLGRPVPIAAGPAGTNAYVCSVEVADFDATWSQILAHGGSEAMGKFRVPGQCWQGYFLDTEGNTVGIFQVDLKAGL
jgi:predicted enzyme related to lactoylglutathione lyase